MYAILYFDTEDSISPPEAGCDDIVLRIADLLSKHDIKGSFHIIGDKARCLEARGRDDIIQALRRHDVSSHYNHGSVHPTTTELVAESNWADGVQVAMEAEKPGFADLERLFGVCGGLTRHGGSYAPQIVRAVGLCGKPFYGVPFQLPGHRAFWMCGNLVYSIMGLVVNEDRGPELPAAMMEPVLGTGEAFTEHLAGLPAAVEACASAYPFTSMFGCHPLRLLTTEFACRNYYNGVNAPKPTPPAQRSREEQRLVWQDFERYVEVLATLQDVKFVGLSELGAHFGSTVQEVSHAYLLDYAGRVADSSAPPLDPYFSPAEMLLAMADWYLAPAGASPAVPLAIRPVIGPTEGMPEATAVERSWRGGNLRDAAQQIVMAAATHGALPASLTIEGEPLGPADALAGLAAAVRQPTNHEWTAPALQAVPQIADNWAENAERMKGWTVFAPDMDFSSIVAHTRRQTWSAKPAQFGSAPACV